MSISWPADLVSDIARRRCVLVLGAGISRHAQNVDGHRPKLWGEFLETALEQVAGPATVRNNIRRLVHRHDLLSACQVIKDTLGPASFHAIANQEFLAPGFHAGAIHDRIIELDSRIVATPNFDTIYENRVNHLQHNTVSVKNYYDNDVAECIRATRRMVLKVHGSIHTPNRMIFTRQDYAIARNRNGSFYSILEALAITHTFVFLGCGLDDPDIRLMLEDYSFKHEFSKPHFFVLPKSQLHRSVLPSIEKSLNIRILTYDTPGGVHDQLVTAIEELKKEVSDERDVLAGSRDW